MRFIAFALMAMSFDASAQTYWLMQQDAGHTWCGYTNTVEFTSDAEKLRPTDSVKVTYSSDKLAEFIYQLEPASGAWIVVDTYTPSPDALILRRTNLLTQAGLQIVQETFIRGGKAEPFRVVGTKSLGGKTVKDFNDSDLPPVKVITDLSGLPFLAVASDMKKLPLPKFCRSF
jgi:hypothetical protein